MRTLDAGLFILYVCTFVIHVSIIAANATVSDCLSLSLSFSVFAVCVVQGASVFAVQSGSDAQGADPITSPGLEGVFTDSGRCFVL